MTESLNPANRREYRRRARPIQFFGFVTFVLGAAGVLRPALVASSSAAQQLAGPVDTLWLLAYLIGGAATSIGVLLLRPAVEVFGEWFIIAAAVINAGAILVNRGPFAGGASAVFILLACWVLKGRIEDLHNAARRDRRVVDVPIPGPERRAP